MKTEFMHHERIIHGSCDASGHWSARFADVPQVSYGGRTTAEAISRLLQTLRDPDLYMWPLSDHAAVDAGTFAIAVGSAPCPDCNGSGRYVGFQAVEPCGTCEGRGRVRLQPVVESCGSEPRRN